MNHKTPGVNAINRLDRKRFKLKSESLSRVRQELTAYCLDHPLEDMSSFYSCDLGKIYKILLRRNAWERPGKCVYQLDSLDSVRGLSNLTGLHAHQHKLLAALLNYRPYDLNGSFALEKIPVWFLEDYMRVMCNPVMLFSESEEPERYFDYFARWIEYLHDSILGNQASIHWHSAAVLFQRFASFMPLYFTTHNLKEIQIKRAEIIEFALTGRGCKLDHQFPDKLTDNNRIHLGILLRTCGPVPETFTALPLIEHLGPGFNITIYVQRQYDWSDSDHGLIEHYIRGKSNNFKMLPSSLEEQVKLIRSDNLDILLVGANITWNSDQLYLLVTHRLARKQLTSAGPVITTGLRNMDYYITGHLTESESNTGHYREKLLWLNGTAQCFSYGPYSDNTQASVHRTELGISENCIVYVSCANIYKVIPELQEVWAQILARVPSSVLMLLPFSPGWGTGYPKDVFAEGLIIALERHGVSPDRLLILDPEPKPDREGLKEYLRVANIYLDSFPYGGTSSLVEPLEVQLPVIVRQGNPFRCAMAGGILKAMNMDRLIARTNIEYVEIAVELAMNIEFRQSIHKNLESQMHDKPVFLDSPSYAGEVAELFRSVL